MVAELEARLDEVIAGLSDQFYPENSEEADPTLHGRLVHLDVEDFSSAIKNQKLLAGSLWQKGCYTAGSGLTAGAEELVISFERL